MAGTYTELLYHIVFSTKERYPLISRDWQDRLHHAAEQDKHHRRKSFQEEFREFLEQAGIAFDERYLW